MSAAQVDNIAARVKANIKELEQERDDLLKTAMARDRLAQSFKQVLKGPRGVLTPTRRGQLVLLLDKRERDLGIRHTSGEKPSWERCDEVAEFLNCSGWRFSDKQGKPRKITSRDVDNGFNSLDL